MNPKIPRVTSKEIASVPRKLGFKRVRTSGSHQIFMNNKGIRVTLPVHSGKIVHPKILKRMIMDIKITIGDFEKLLSK